MEIRHIILTKLSWLHTNHTHSQEKNTLSIITNNSLLLKLEVTEMGRYTAALIM